MDVRDLSLVFLVAATIVSSGCRRGAVPETVSTTMGGTWKANLVKSTLHPSFRFLSVTLHVSEADGMLTLVVELIDSSGHESRRAETLRLHGAPTGSTVSFLARWVGRQILASGTSNHGQPMAFITYALSPDGNALAVRHTDVQEQVLLLERN